MRVEVSKTIGIGAGAVTRTVSLSAREPREVSLEQLRVLWESLEPQSIANPVARDMQTILDGIGAPVPRPEKRPPGRELAPPYIVEISGQVGDGLLAGLEFRWPVRWREFMVQVVGITDSFDGYSGVTFRYWLVG